MNLSKSRYVAGLQCPKIVWMNKNMPEQRAEQDDLVFIRGIEVGDYAKEFYSPCAEVEYDENLTIMVENTRKLLESDAPVIAEASFSYDRNFCSVDILKKNENGYEIIEVKSSSGADGNELEDLQKIAKNKTYLDDMAYQYYVVSSWMKENLPGRAVTKVSLLRLNKEYTRSNGEPLFIPLDCTNEVTDRQKDIENNIKHILKIAGQKDEPTEKIGIRCDEPHECGFKKWCFKDLPENNVFDIGWSMNKKKKYEAYDSGIISFQDVLDAGIKLPERASRQVEFTVNNSEPYIDKTQIHEFLYKSLDFPLYFLDFEWLTMMPIPPHDNLRPYENSLFQYSIHLQKERRGPVEHMEFLGLPGVDSRRALAAQLCADIPKGSCITSFSAASAEKPRLRELAKLFPDLSEHLLDIDKNTVDLAEPFRKGHYYCTQMRGKFSIKSVLPALFPDDPELSYEELEIKKYGGVIRIYSQMFKEHTLEDVPKKIEALLKYCRLDTLAMAKIVNKLHEIIGEQ